MSDRIRIGIVGCGRQAQLGYLYWLKNHPKARAAACADPFPNRARKALNGHKNAQAYTDAREMISKEKLDAVVVTSPPWHHREAVETASEYRVPILCEKPMASNIEDARAMVSAAESAGVPLFIGFNCRFDPAVFRAAELLRDGIIGKIFSVTGYFGAYVPSFDNRLVKTFFRLIKVFGMTPETHFGAWRQTDPRAGGGCFADHGVHWFDLFRWYLDDEAASVCATIDSFIPRGCNEDHAMALIRFRKGVPGFIETTSSEMHASRLQHWILLSGEKGSLRVVMDNTWFVKGVPLGLKLRSKLEIYDLKSIVRDKWRHIEVPRGPNAHLTKRQLDVFIDKVRCDFTPHPTLGDMIGHAHDGIRSMEMLDAVYRSARDKSVINL